MHLALEKKYQFFISEKLQRRHLRDIKHLERAHRVTLFGLKVGRIWREEGATLFDISRFGRTQTIRLVEEGQSICVAGPQFKFHFDIEPEENFHWLRVRLSTPWRWMFLLKPFFEALFWMTVIEDRLYWD